MSNCFPILGGTSIPQLETNIAALKITLTPDQLKKLNDGSPFDHGFPTNRFGLDPRLLEDQEPQVPLIKTVSFGRWSRYSGLIVRLELLSSLFGLRQTGWRMGWLLKTVAIEKYTCKKSTENECFESMWETTSCHVMHHMSPSVLNTRQSCGHP